MIIKVKVKEKILKKREKGEKMYVLGIDSGSTSTNAVILDDKRNIVAFYVLRTGAKSIESASKARDEVIKKAGLKAEDIDLIVATGYGRVSIPMKGLKASLNVGVAFGIIMKKWVEYLNKN